MPNCLFQFKQFGVWSHIGGFKVGTDAVLLGAWADVENAGRVLEIGAGTGVVSLMLAQRSSASIEAVEIDGAASYQAKFNFERSRFGNLTVARSSIQDFAITAAQQFDHIVCNPPYFQLSSKPESETLHMAKHADSLLPNELMACVSTLISRNGSLTMVIPYSDLEEWSLLARQVDLHTVRQLLIRPKPSNDLKRVLVEWKRGFAGICSSSELTLENGNSENREYTDSFKALLKNYFIKF